MIPLEHTPGAEMLDYRVGLACVGLRTTISPENGHSGHGPNYSLLEFFPLHIQAL
jgi:hypothetical protein